RSPGRRPCRSTWASPPRRPSRGRTCPRPRRWRAPPPPARRARAARRCGPRCGASRSGPEARGSPRGRSLSRPRHGGRGAYPLPEAGCRIGDLATTVMASRDAGRSRARLAARGRGRRRHRRGGPDPGLPRRPHPEAMAPRAAGGPRRMIAIPAVAGISVLLLVLLGFVVGVLGGFFGVGGTWIVTPGLNLLGLPIAFAVGTDLLHTMGKSIVATIKHRRFGHVDVRLGAFMIVGTANGLKIGETALLALERAGNADSVVRILYILILFFISGYVLWDYRRAAVTRAPRGAGKVRLYEKVQALKLPPYLSLPASGIPRISAWVPFLLALVTGVASGLLGVGAGFIRMPSLVYLLGVPTKIAVGTDLFEIIFSAGIGAFLY